MAFLSRLPLDLPTRLTYTGEEVVAPIAQRTAIRKLPRPGATTLQELYGPEYVKRGFSWTPLDLLAPAVNLAAGLVPGGQQILALGGALGMNNGGFEQPTGIGYGGVGVGICPPGTRCVGASAFGACLGTCVPTGTATLPGGPMIIAPGGTQFGAPYGNGAPANGARAAGAQVCCPPGYRPNRSAYYSRGIKDGLGPRWVERGTQCVRSRRTNPLNPRAASRAGRRLRSASKASRWLARVKVPKKLH